MTLHEAEHHQVHVDEIEVFQFSQDKEWFATFKPHVEAFYTQHLEWFYDGAFNMELARSKIEGLLTEVDAKRKIAASKKRKL
jgi:hypothetical protein